MPRRKNWDYFFEGASSILERQPAQVPVSRYPLLVGIDGRYEGVARRYPGHIRYPDSTSALGDGTDFNVDFCRPFVVARGAGTDGRVRGFVVGDYVNGDIEIWYRQDDDTDGEITKYSIIQNTKAVGKLRTTGLNEFQVLGTGVDSNSAFDFNLPAHLGTSSTVRVLCFETHDDGQGHGDQVYAGGVFTLAGSRTCYGIARYNQQIGNWEPVGLGFNGPVCALKSYGGKLYAGGKFTLADGQTANNFAVWDGLAWVEAGQGVDDAVYTLETWTHIAGGSSGTQFLYVGGDFDNVRASGTPLSCRKLAEYDDDDDDFNDVFGTDFGASDAVYALHDGGPVNDADALLPDALYVGGSFGTVGGQVMNNWGYITVSTATPTYNGVTDTGTSAVGVNDEVYCFQKQNVVGAGINHGQIRAGGKFDRHTGEVTATLKNHVFNWNGTTSNNVIQIYSGDFTGNYVNAWLNHSSGEVLIGGDFTEFNGTTCSGLIKNSVTDVDQETSGGWCFALHPVAEATVGLDSLLNYEVLWGGEYIISESPVSNGNLTWDLAIRGRYLYLLCSNGNHLVLYWDEPNSTWAVERFGVEQTLLDAATLAEGGVATDRLQAGAYRGAYRYYDPIRLRWTALSEPSADAAFSADKDNYKLTQAGGFSTIPSTYSKVEVFSTLSTLDENVAAGGQMYRAGRGSTNGTSATSSFNFIVGSDENKDDGNGTIESALSDSSLPTQPRYRIEREQVGEVGAVQACAHFQGVTFALEVEDAYLALRWSPSSRLEPENFPPINIFRTHITKADALSCRFIEAGDFLYLFGGDRVYRIQRAGLSVGVTQIARGYPFLHRDSIVTVGGRIYAATELGILELDARSGSGRVNNKFHKIFFDRWRGNLEASHLTKSLRLGYDARMECIYMHNRALGETLCFWLTTGKVSILMGTFSIDAIAEGQDLDDEVSHRSYFISSRRWFAEANWNPDPTLGEAQTISGFPLDTDQSDYKFNAQPTAVAEVSGNTRLTFGAGTPFTMNSSTTTLDAGPTCLAALSGGASGEVFKVLSSTSNTVTIEGDHTANIDTDTWVAFAPVIFGIVGSNLWKGRGIPDLRRRKKTMGMGYVVGRVNAPGHANHQQATIDSSLSHMRLGVMRNDDILANEPRAATDRVIFQAHKEVNGPTGALDTDRPSENWASIAADGTILYPYLLCLSSNLQFELYQIMLKGRTDQSEISGAGT